MNDDNGINSGQVRVYQWSGMAWEQLGTDIDGEAAGDSCNSGTIEYDIPSINRQGIIPITRVANDNIVICEALKAEDMGVQTFLGVQTFYVQTFSRILSISFPYR